MSLLAFDLSKDAKGQINLSTKRVQKDKIENTIYLLPSDVWNTSDAIPEDTKSEQSLDLLMSH